MKVYIDSECKCHVTNDGTMTTVEDTFFDNKCAAFIEGYVVDDSKGYRQIYPWKDHSELDAAQRSYERNLLAEYEALINELYQEATA